MVPDGSGRHDRRHAIRRHALLHRLRRRLRRHGGVRQARLRRGRDASGRCSRVRFTLAAALFWVLVARRRARAARAAAPRRRGSASGSAPCGYALQAGCYFAALERIEAPLLALLLYTFPAIVAAAAVALGRERFGGRHVIARPARHRRPHARASPARARARSTRSASRSALGAAVVYSAYILVSDGIAGRIRPQVLATLVCTGAAVTLLARLDRARRVPARRR